MTTRLRAANTSGYDLWHDATSVGADLVVETWISHGPRASDTTFDPQPGEWVLVGDDEEPPCPARVTRRNANHVWVQLELASSPVPVPALHPNDRDNPAEELHRGESG